MFYDRPVTVAAAQSVVKRTAPPGSRLVFAIKKANCMMIQYRSPALTRAFGSKLAVMLAALYSSASGRTHGRRHRILAGRRAFVRLLGTADRRLRTRLGTTVQSAVGRMFALSAQAGVHASRMVLCTGCVERPRRDSGVLEFVVELLCQRGDDTRLTGQRRNQNPITGRAVICR
jgi:hypothetical protein